MTDDLDDLAKARRQKVIKSIDWEAIERGESCTFDVDIGEYVSDGSSQPDIEEKNAAIQKRLENRRKL